MRPHVVILGSGASKAAIPNGDKNGRNTSAMNGFLSELKMDDLIQNVKLRTRSGNLEDVYSEIAGQNKYQAEQKALEISIYDHFSALTIPETPTVYDYLILSLTNKDLITTFNWDPLLLQAYQRVAPITSNLPQLTFLHGNVSYGSCAEHGVTGAVNSRCSKCKRKLAPSRLLFPATNKNYTADALLAFNWKKTQRYIQKASMVTIFGYSAPKTDASGIRLLQRAWEGGRVNREFTIIDILPKDVLLKTWRTLISNPVQTAGSFFESRLARHPRRSCEVLRAKKHDNSLPDDCESFRPGLSFRQLRAHLQPLTEQELEYGSRPLPVISR